MIIMPRSPSGSDGAADARWGRDCRTRSIVPLRLTLRTKSKSSRLNGCPSRSRICSSSISGAAKVFTRGLSPSQAWKHQPQG